MQVRSQPFCLPLPLPLPLPPFPLPFPLPHRPFALPGLPPLAPGQSESVSDVEGSLAGGLCGWVGLVLGGLLGLGKLGVAQLLHTVQALSACWRLVPAGRPAVQLSHWVQLSLVSTTTGGGGGGGGATTGTPD